jgi:hypothetical protein
MLEELIGQRQERSLELGRAGSNRWTERRRGRSAADKPRRARGEDLHRGRDARGGRLADGPGSDEVLGESADVVPIFVPSEPFQKLVSELVAECRLDVSPLEAAPGADHAVGQRVDPPPEMREPELKQLALPVPSLAFLLSGLDLTLGSLDHACDERLHVAQGR